MLHAGAAEEVDILLDLGRLLAHCGLVDWHFEGAVRRGHDDGAQGGEVGADVCVVDAPEAVEVERRLVVGARAGHAVPVLVADDVVDCAEGDGWEGGIEGVVGSRGGEVAWQEGAGVGVPLDEGVDCVAVGAHGGCDYSALFGGGCCGRLDADGAGSDRCGVQCTCIVDCKRDVLTRCVSLESDGLTRVRD